jgi:hypothetical protein
MQMILRSEISPLEKSSHAQNVWISPLEKCRELKFLHWGNQFMATLSGFLHWRDAHDPASWNFSTGEINPCPHCLDFSTGEMPRAEISLLGK